MPDPPAVDPDPPAGDDLLPELPPPSWRERVDGVMAVLGWSPLSLVATALVVGAVAVGGYLLMRPPPDPPEVALPLATTVVPTTDAVAAEIVVHVAGAVAQPGVHRLPGGARVADAVDAAGGLAADADHERLNLAAPVGDGDRVYVPRVGQTDVPPVASPGAGSSGGSADGDGTEPIDLNTASLEELDRLPGVGPATAAAIVDHRERSGPFASVDELIEVRGIGEAKLAQLRDRVRV